MACGVTTKSGASTPPAGSHRLSISSRPDHTVVQRDEARGVLRVIRLAFSPLPVRLAGVVQAIHRMAADFAGHLATSTDGRSAGPAGENFVASRRDAGTKCSDRREERSGPSPDGRALPLVTAHSPGGDGTKVSLNIGRTGQEPDLSGSNVSGCQHIKMGPGAQGVEVSAAEMGRTKPGDAIHGRCVCPWVPPRDTDPLAGNS